MTTAINLKTANLRRLPALLNGMRVSQSTDPKSYPDGWAEYAGTEPVPSGYRATGWIAELRPTGGWRIPILEKRDINAEKLKELEPHIATIQSLIQVNYTAGFTKLPKDNYEASTMAQDIIDTATLEQIKAALLYKHIRDSLIEDDVKWSDIVWLEAYSKDHPEVWD